MFSPDVEKILTDLETPESHILFPSVPREVGEYLYSLVKKYNPRRIVEVGSCAGYSTIWLGMAAKDIGSTIEAYEFSADRYKYLKENISRVGLDQTVQIHLENAKLGLPKLEGEFDLVFIDAMKQEYIEYFNLLEPKLSTRAIVLADNILSHRAELQGYVEYVKNNSNFQSQIEPLGSGLLISYKKS